MNIEGYLHSHGASLAHTLYQRSKELGFTDHKIDKVVIDFFEDKESILIEQSSEKELTFKLAVNIHFEESPDVALCVEHIFDFKTKETVSEENGPIGQSFIASVIALQEVMQESLQGKTLTRKNLKDFEKKDYNTQLLQINNLFSTVELQLKSGLEVTLSSEDVVHEGSQVIKQSKDISKNVQWEHRAQTKRLSEVVKKAITNPLADQQKQELVEKLREFKQTCIAYVQGLHEPYNIEFKLILQEVNYYLKLIDRESYNLDKETDLAVKQLIKYSENKGELGLQEIYRTEKAFVEQWEAQLNNTLPDKELKELRELSHKWFSKNKNFRIFNEAIDSFISNVSNLSMVNDPSINKCFSELKATLKENLKPKKSNKSLFQKITSLFRSLAFRLNGVSKAMQKIEKAERRALNKYLSKNQSKYGPWLNSHDKNIFIKAPKTSTSFVDQIDRLRQIKKVWLAKENELRSKKSDFDDGIYQAEDLINEASINLNNWKMSDFLLDEESSHFELLIQVVQKILTELQTDYENMTKNQSDLDVAMNDLRSEYNEIKKTLGHRDHTFYEYTMSFTQAKDQLGPFHDLIDHASEEKRNLYEKVKADLDQAQKQLVSFKPAMELDESFVNHINELLLQCESLNEYFILLENDLDAQDWYDHSVLMLDQSRMLQKKYLDRIEQLVPEALYEEISILFSEALSLAESLLENPSNWSDRKKRAEFGRYAKQMDNVNSMYHKVADYFMKQEKAYRQQLKSVYDKYPIKESLQYYTEAKAHLRKGFGKLSACSEIKELCELFLQIQSDQKERVQELQLALKKESSLFEGVYSQAMNKFQTVEQTFLSEELLNEDFALIYLSSTSLATYFAKARKDLQKQLKIKANEVSLQDCQAWTQNWLDDLQGVLLESASSYFQHSYFNKINNDYKQIESNYSRYPSLFTQYQAAIESFYKVESDWSSLSSLEDLMGVYRSAESKYQSFIYEKKRELKSLSLNIDKEYKKLEVTIGQERSAIFNKIDLLCSRFGLSLDSIKALVEQQMDQLEDVLQDPMRSLSQSSQALFELQLLKSDVMQSLEELEGKSSKDQSIQLGWTQKWHQLQGQFEVCPSLKGIKARYEKSLKALFEKEAAFDQSGTISYPKLDRIIKNIPFEVFEKIQQMQDRVNNSLIISNKAAQNLLELFENNLETLDFPYNKQHLDSFCEAFDKSFQMIEQNWKEPLQFVESLRMNDISELLGSALQEGEKIELVSDVMLEAFSNLCLKATVDHDGNLHMPAEQMDLYEQFSQVAGEYVFFNQIQGQVQQHIDQLNLLQDELNEIEFSLDTTHIKRAIKEDLKRAQAFKGQGFDRLKIDQSQEVSFSILIDRLKGRSQEMTNSYSELDSNCTSTIANQKQRIDQLKASSQAIDDIQDLFSSQSLLCSTLEDRLHPQNSSTLATYGSLGSQGYNVLSQNMEDFPEYYKELARVLYSIYPDSNELMDASDDNIIFESLQGWDRALFDSSSIRSKVYILGCEFVLTALIDADIDKLQQAINLLQTIANALNHVESDPFAQSIIGLGMHLMTSCSAFRKLNISDDLYSQFFKLARLSQDVNSIEGKMFDQFKQVLHPSNREPVYQLIFNQTLMQTNTLLQMIDFDISNRQNFENWGQLLSLENEQIAINQIDQLLKGLFSDFELFKQS